MPQDEALVIEKILPRLRTDARGCWLWTGHVRRDGYGQFGSVRVHKAVYEHFNGAIPDGLELDHLCRVRRCANPEHLEPVTHRENVLRGEGVAGRAARVTHCPRGHEYTEENIYRPPGGLGHHRQCRTCMAERPIFVFDPARHKHGRGGYVGGCRCDVCRTANRQRSQEWRDKQKARA